MFLTTVSCFSNLIVLENVFCVNRSHLIDCSRKKLIGGIIFTTVLTLLAIVVIFDILRSNVSFIARAFELFLSVEFFTIAISAKFQNNSFGALKRLDEKCGTDSHYVEQLEAISTKYSCFLFACAVIDVIALSFVSSSLTEAFIFFILYSAQDAELIFFSMIVEAINLRLSQLQYASPVVGSRVYRHVLVATAVLNEEITPKMLLMLTVVLGTTVMYSSVIMLLPADLGTHVLIYLLWRELKAFFCLWRVCYESSRSDSICQQLAFHLAKILALDPSVDKVKSKQTRGVLSRWYRAVLSERPRFMSGSVLSISLAVPLHLLDLSVNYVLIIVQIYAAYN